MDRKELTPDEKLRKERIKRQKLQVKLKEMKRRSDILTAVSILLVIAIAIGVIFTISKNLNTMTEDTASKLSKDNAISALMELPLLSVTIDGNDIQIKNMSELFTILSPGTWEVTTEKPKGDEKVKFSIESGYTLTLFDGRYVRIADGASTRTYKTETVLASEVSTFIYDNTTLTAEDLSSLISQTKEVFYNSPYYSDYITAGTGLSAALDPISWTEIDFYPASENPTTTITAWDNVTVSLYDDANVGVVIFNGNSVFYSFSGEVISDLKNYISKNISSAADEIKPLLSAYHEISLMTPENQYTVIPDDSFISMLRFEEWRRILEVPQLPASPAYDITDSKEFSLRFFKEECIAELNGGELYYTVPFNIFVDITLYIQKATAPTVPDDVPEEEKDQIISDLITLLKNAETAGLKVSVKTDKKSAALQANEDFRLLLNPISWTKQNMPADLNVDTARSMTFTVADANAITIYNDYNVAVVTLAGKQKTVYSCPIVIAPQIEAYTEANAVEETFTVTHSELIEMLMAQTDLHAAAYEGVLTNFTNGYADSVSDMVKWISSLSLKELHQKPTVSTDKKIVLTFGGEQDITLTFSSLSDETGVINVYSKNEADGSVINTWFSVQNKTYLMVGAEVTAYMSAMVDDAAITFANAIKNSDLDAIASYLKVDDMAKWGYDKFFSAAVSDAKIDASDTANTYVLTLDVSDNKDSTLIKGENKFLMTVTYSQTDGKLYVSSLKNTSSAGTSAEITAEVSDLLTFISRCTDKPFASPADIDKDHLINYCMFLMRKYGDNTKTEFTQADINAVARTFFEIDSVSNAESPLFNAETGLYTFAGTAAVTPAVTVTKTVTNGDVYEITVARTSDPLGIFLTDPITYTLKKVTVSKDVVIEGATPDETRTETHSYTYYVYSSAIAEEAQTN